MKIRLLEKELQKLGYQLKRRKGSHRIFFNPTTNHTFPLSGNKGSEAKPYQLKFIR